jgi:hypothetical protein
LPSVPLSRKVWPYRDSFDAIIDHYLVKFNKYIY